MCYKDYYRYTYGLVRRRLDLTGPSEPNIVLEKIDTILGINIYSAACNYISTDGTIIYLELSSILHYGFPITCGILDDDLNYNHVNDICENYCSPPPGSDVYGAYLHISVNKRSAITIFATNM